MQNGLHVWQDKKNNITLDADNLFWAASPVNNRMHAFISDAVLNLYAKVKNKITREMTNFRFDKELSAIYIDPTDRCNAACPYCYVPQKIRQNGRSMTKDELDFILTKIARYFKDKKRKAVIIFHASEPLLVKEIIFSAIRNYSKIFKFGLQTNAILLEKEDVGFLKKYGVGVGISLDASSPVLNNRARPAAGVGGNFVYAVRAIKWFNGYAGLNIIATITKNNVKNLPGLVKFLHTKKVPCVLLNPVRITQKSSRGLKPDTGLMAKYFLKAVDAALGLSQKTRQRIIIGNFANTILAIISPVARRLMCDISPCGGGRCFFTITASGEMIPCGEFIGLKGFSGGNIFTDSVEKAMASKPFNRIRSRFVEKIKECAECVLRNICGAPCPAELHSLGNMYKKAVFCDFYKEVIRYAFKVIVEGKEKYALRNEGIENLKYTYKFE